MVAFLNLKNATVIELFSGAGLLSYAFASEGFSIIKAYELDEAATHTYRKNLGNHVEQADISKLKPNGKCDVLIAGPPCQGFSSIGKRDKNDPRNSLGLKVLEWARVTKPKVVLIENVAPFLISDTWQQLKKGFEKSGYEVKGKVVQATDFGVPQFRKRSITICSRIGFPDINTESSVIQTVEDAIGDLGDTQNPKIQHTWQPSSYLAKQRIILVPQNGDIRDIAKLKPELVPQSWWKVEGKIIDIWGRMNWDAPSKTIRAGFMHPSKGRYLHPSFDRLISLREAARLQTVPDEFIFTGTPVQIARQIGNGVPIKMGVKIANAISKLL